jgi:SAF domain-containing protein
MKTMKNLYMAPLFLLLTSCNGNELTSCNENELRSCNYNDHIIIAMRDIPVGTVLQYSDFRLDHGWTLHDEGACLSLPSHVIGHKTLRSVVEGQVIRPSYIAGGLKSCPENVADGWWGGYDEDPTPLHH